MWIAVLFAVVAIIVIARFVMERIETGDRNAGLNIERREYGIARTLSHAFSSDEKRMALEMRQPFAAFAKREEKAAGRNAVKARLVTACFAGAAVVLGAVFNRAEMFVALFVLMVMFLPEFRHSLFMIVITVMITLLSAMTPVSLLLAVPEGYMALNYGRMRKRYRKWLDKNNE